MNQEMYDEMLNALYLAETYLVINNPDGHDQQYADILKVINKVIMRAEGLDYRVSEVSRVGGGSESVCDHSVDVCRRVDCGGAMSVKHTPGPWQEFEDKNGNLRVGSAEHSIALVKNPFLDNQANARLIAAAPEMLELLRSLFEIGKRDLTNPKYDSYFDSIRDILAKAEGK